MLERKIHGTPVLSHTHHVNPMTLDLTPGMDAGVLSHSHAQHHETSIAEAVSQKSQTKRDTVFHSQNYRPQKPLTKIQTRTTGGGVCVASDGTDHRHPFPVVSDLESLAPH